VGVIQHSLMVVGAVVNVAEAPVVEGVQGANFVMEAEDAKRLWL